MITGNFNRISRLVRSHGIFHNPRYNPRSSYVSPEALLPYHYYQSCSPVTGMTCLINKIFISTLIAKVAGSRYSDLKVRLGGISILGTQLQNTRIHCPTHETVLKTPHGIGYWRRPELCPLQCNSKRKRWENSPRSSVLILWREQQIPLQKLHNRSLRPSKRNSRQIKFHFLSNHVRTALFEGCIHQQ